MRCQLCGHLVEYCQCWAEPGEADPSVSEAVIILATLLGAVVLVFVALLLEGGEVIRK